MVPLGSDDFDAPTVYAAELQRYGGVWLGHALWYPSPDRGEEVQIGDVGFVKEGRFRRFFNVVTEDGFIDGKRPENFTPLKYTTALQDGRTMNTTPIVSKSVTIIEASADIQAHAGAVSAGAGCRFSCESRQGAVLHLKPEARMLSVDPNECFRSYMKENYRGWIQYVRNTSSRIINADSIILVRGFVKTSEWAIATFKSSNFLTGASINAGFTPAQTVGFELSVARRSGMLCAWNTGPSGPDVILDYHDTHLPTNQCIFLRYYKMKFRFGLFPAVMEAGAGPAPLPDRLPEDNGQGVLADDDFDVETEGPEPSEKSITAIDALLDYILENSSADVAIASEGELELLLQGSEVPSDIPNYLRIHRPQIDQDQDSVGMLSLASITLGNQRQRRQRSQRDNDFGKDSSKRGVATQTLPEQLVLASGRTFEWPDTVLRDWSGETSINSCAVSNSGQHALTCLDDGSIRLWDISTGRSIRTYEGHEESVMSVAFSPDDTKFVSGSDDSTAKLWNISEEHSSHTLEGHEQLVWCVAWSPDGSTIATGSVDQTVRLWNPDGSERSTLEHDGQVTIIEFSHDGKSLLVTADSVGHIWDCGTGELRFKLDAHTGPIWSAKFSRNGDRVITASEDGTARIWDAQSGYELVTLREHSEPVWTAEFSPDGKYVASGSQDGTIAVCDSFGGEPMFQIVKAPLAHIYSLAYSHSGSFIASADAGGSVKVWDGKSGAFVAEFQGHDEKVKSVVWTPDDRFVVSSSEDGTVRAWSILDMLRLQ